MDLEFSGKVAVITGAASGIGRATAIAFAGRGCAVALLDRDAVGLADVAMELREADAVVDEVVLDLADLNSLPRVISDIIARNGDIDFLANCAAAFEDPVEPLDVDLDTWEWSMSVNVKGPLVLMQQVGRNMVARGKGGKIVNVTSSSAFRAQSLAAYSAGKAALTQLSRVMANQLAQYDINVNCVAPGVTRTKVTTSMDREANVRSGPMANMFHRVSEPEDVAEVIVFLCSRGSRQITAQTVHTSAGSVIS